MKMFVQSYRDLDKLVALHVLSWRHVHEIPEGAQLSINSRIAVCLDDATRQEIQFVGFRSEQDYQRLYQEMVPFYSADISAAWEIVDKFDDPHTSVVIENYSSGWCCRIVKSSPEIFQGLAKTAPIAICLAALKTVGIEVEFQELAG